MAGNRPNGGIGFSNNFEPQVGAPLDARGVVPSKSDLYLSATWTANDGGIYVYDGLTVTVWNDAAPADNGVYVLQDAVNYATPASWLFVGSGGGGGAQGAQGATGAQGADGQQGNTGAQGADGQQGAQGADGQQGSAGAQGQQGADGQQGAQGADGQQGAQGAEGQQGSAGAQGQQGADGQQGAQGADGQQGAQGAEGQQGSAGAQGQQGADGQQGAQGADGQQGAQGAEGQQGSAGAQGQQGADGQQGAQGPGGNYTAGDGINIDTATNPDTIEVDLGDGCDTYGPNLEFDGNGKLDFKGVHIRDENVAVGTYPVINFVGADVLAEDSGDPCMVNVYIPTPTFLPYFNTSNSQGDASVDANIYPFNDKPRISDPTTEGTPFKVNGWGGSARAAYRLPTSTGRITYSTVGPCTGFSGSISGDAKIVVTLYDADGITALQTLDTSTTNALYQNQTFTDGAGLSVVITNHAPDLPTKFKAEVDITVDAGTILAANGLTGGRYHVGFVMTTDTTSDTGTAYPYYGPNGNSSTTYTPNNQDVFFDTNPSTPNINGTVTIAESTTPANILTKHLSGVEYYILGSQFEFDVNDIDNYNENTQGRSGDDNYNFQGLASDYGMTNSLNLKAWSPTVGTFINWTDLYNQQNVNFDYDTWPINNTFYRFRAPDATSSGRVYDPWNTGNLVNSAGAPILVDTYLNRSTNLGEAFADETERLYRNTGTNAYDVWDSTLALTDATQGANATGSAGTFENGCVVGSYLLKGSQFFRDNGDSPQIGTLIPDLSSYKPDKNGSNPNYSALSNIPVYHRRFYTADARAISNVDIVFTGNFGSSGNAETALINSQMKIYIRREATNSAGSFGFTANPLAVHGGEYNSGAPGSPFNDGASGVDTLGSLIRTGSSSGNNINFTFGPGTQLAVGGFWVEIQLVASDIKLDTMNLTLNFSSGSPETNNALTPN